MSHGDLQARIHRLRELADGLGREAALWKGRSAPLPGGRHPGVGDPPRWPHPFVGEWSIVFVPHLGRMSPGNLQLEWHQGPKVLELEFESPQMIRYLQYDPRAGVEEEDSFWVTDIDRAVDLIQWFMSGTCV